MFFEVSDLLYLRLHKGYSVPAEANRKLSKQRVGPFKIIEQVGCLAYCLDLPQHWRVCNVIFVAHLEPAAKGDDPYQRLCPENSAGLIVEGNEEYKVEKSPKNFGCLLYSWR